MSEYVSCPECGACLPNGKELRCCACNHLLDWQPFFSGNLVPEPAPGDVVLVDGVERKLLLFGCSCFGRNPPAWPPPVGCGIHVEYMDGCPYGFILWSLGQGGWHCSGVILQRTKAVVVAALDPATLRVANTRPGATMCAKCGKPLKDPMPWLSYMKHCPKCEP